MNVTFRQILFRTLAGVGALTLLAGLMGGLIFWRWVNQPRPMPRAPVSMVLELDFTHPVVERKAGLAFSIDSFLNREDEVALVDILRAIARAKKDDRVKGIVARLGENPPTLARIQEIRDALESFRQSGKFTYIFAPSYGGFGQGSRAYYLASAFENIWLQPVGGVGLTGLAIESPFAHAALDKIGITPDFMRREEYKSVMENATRDDFSPPVRANMESMLGSLQSQIVDGIAKSRNVQQVKAKTWMERGPYTAPEALQEGLVTHIGYANEMLETAKLMGTRTLQKTQKIRSPVNVSVGEYLAYANTQQVPMATIALIDGEGMIVDNPDGPARFSRNDVMDTEEIVTAFEDAAQDPDVDAILFRVNSPGGSPEASETIRHALILAKKEKKPVFVSMGDVAASGGYWIAMDADHIVAEPGTLTGSIGVVAGKFVADGLSKKLGVSWDRIVTSDNAGMWSVARPFSPQDRERVNAFLDYTYRLFTENVAQARHIPVEKMPDIAKGRVWTGEQAVKVGLVDELGGLQTTVNALKKRLDLKEDDGVILERFPAPVTAKELIKELLHNVGFNLNALRSSLGVLQQTEQVLAPIVGAITPMGTISAQMPAYYYLETAR